MVAVIMLPFLYTFFAAFFAVKQNYKPLPPFARFFFILLDRACIYPLPALHRIMQGSSCCLASLDARLLKG